MARTIFIAGNWKMNTLAEEARQLATAVVQGAPSPDQCRVAVCPPFVWLGQVAEVIRDTPVDLGAQNLYPKTDGAFTGEISPTMLRNAGCQLVIVGHSERRHVLHEADAFINQKILAALAAGLEVIFCIGETLDQREANQTEAVVEQQLVAGLQGITVEQMAALVIAYEPVWAIGTGRNATPDQAQAAHAFIRQHLAKVYDSTVAERTIIQYGGSVKPDNAASLLAQPDVDGALVGGASLKADQFLGIIDAAS